MTSSPDTSEARLRAQLGRAAGQARRRAAIAALAVVLLGSCELDMVDQPKYEALEPAEAFPHDQAALPLVPHTVARGRFETDELLHDGTISGNVADVFPFPITLDDLQRGQERFRIYCRPCHGELGYGDGMIVRRGFKQPPSYHSDRLRQIPVGYLFNVITNGFGAMAEYGGDIAAADRWRIVAYIRALQLSQHAQVAELPDDARKRLVGSP